MAAPAARAVVGGIAARAAGELATRGAGGTGAMYAVGLGAAGLVPFAALAPYPDDLKESALPPLPEWAAARRVALQKAYGACILSFLGGIHWGVAVAGGAMPGLRYVYSVAPSLVAWPALACEDDAAALKLLIGGLCGAFVADVGLALATRRAPHLPAYYLPLRTVLTAGASASLGATLCELEPHTCEAAWKALREGTHSFAAIGSGVGTGSALTAQAKNALQAVRPAAAEADAPQAVAEKAVDEGALDVSASTTKGK